MSEVEASPRTPPPPPDNFSHQDSLLNVRNSNDKGKFKKHVQAFFGGRQGFCQRKAFTVASREGRTCSPGPYLCQECAPPRRGGPRAGAGQSTPSLRASWVSSGALSITVLHFFQGLPECGAGRANGRGRRVYQEPFRTAGSRGVGGQADCHCVSLAPRKL